MKITTDLQKSLSTDPTSFIEERQIKKVARDSSQFYPQPEPLKPWEDYSVRAGKNQTSVSLSINTTRMVERREMQQMNSLKPQRWEDKYL